MNVDKESFASLMGLKEQLKVKQEEEARIAAEKEQKRKEAEAKAHEFENAMKELGVKKKIGREDKVFHAMPKPAPIPRQRYADEKAVLEDSLSDNISIDHLLDSDERLSYRAPSMAPDVPKKLHQGAWSVKGTLDLHGYTSEEARLLLVEFLNEERKPDTVPCESSTDRIRLCWTEACFGRFRFGWLSERGARLCRRRL
ncbi:MAG: Smr/MutS family protein [Parasutterella excrementihominis]